MTTARPVTSAAPRLAARAQAARSLRRRRRLRHAGWVLAALVPLALVGWLLLASPVLAVRTVAVSGTERLTVSQVRAAAAVPPGVPLARVDTASVAHRVRALPAVAAVQVSRGWPGTLRLRVTERTPVAALVGPGGVTLVDGTGVAFASAAAVPAGLFRLQVPHEGAADGTTQAALTVARSLPPPLRSQLRIVRAGSPSSVTLVLAGGRQVLWGGVEQPRLKVMATSALLRLPGRLYDVSRPEVVTRR